MHAQTPQKRVPFARALRRDILRVFAMLVLVCAVFVALRPVTTTAATPTLNFQARLENASGAIAPDGTYNVEFKLYQGGTTSGGGTLKWTEDWLNSATNGVKVSNGYLTANLGSITSFPSTINWDADLFLSMNIGGTATGTPTWDGEMTPLLKLTSVPYAFQSQSAQQLQTIQGSYTGNLSFDSLTANRNILLPNENGTICIQGSANCGFLTGAAASGSYVQLQGSFPGTVQSGNFNISGTGSADALIASTGVYAPLLDTASAGALSIGTTNATAINLNQNTTIGAGKTLTVSSGTTTLTGAATSSAVPTYVGGGSTQGYTSSIVINNPSGTTGGDLAMLFVGVNAGQTVTPPSGWTAASDTSTGGTYNVNGYWFYKTISNSEASSWTFAVSTTANTSSTLVVYRNVTLGTNAVSHSTANVSSFNTPTLSSAANSLIISSWVDIASSGGGVPTISNQIIDRTGTIVGTDNWSRSVAGEETMASAGTTTARTTTFSSTASSVARAIELQAYTTGPNALVVSNSTSTGSILVAKDDTTTVFTVGNEGSITAQNSTNSTSAFAINRADGTGVLTVNTATPTVTLNAAVVVAASQSLTLTGGTTATRPASPTEGMLYYDTSTKKLLVYSNGKWQADRSTATKIVAASNSSQAAKDAADYVATGTGDQATINSALTAAAGGKVYLMEGTYTINASISVPNNTTLAGAGQGTVITIPSAFNADLNVVTNTTNAGSGTGVTIQDIQFNGNMANQTAGNMFAVYLDGMGALGTGTFNGLQGAKLNNLWIKDFKGATSVNGSYAGGGIKLINSANTTVSNTTITNHTNSGGTGITLSSSNSNSFTNNIVQGTFSCLYMDSSSTNTFSGNTFENCPDYAVNMSGASPSSYNTFSSNTFKDVYTAFGIYDGGTHNTISSNTFMDTSGQTSTYIDITSGQYDTITGNSFSFDSSYSGGGVTISQATSGYITVSGNTIDGGWPAIGIWNNAHDNNISGNTITNSGGTTHNEGIEVSNSASSNTITGNNITDSNGHTTDNYAINISTSNVSSTYLANNTLGGATINDASTTTIYGGQLNGSSAYVLQASGGISLNSAVTASASLTVTNAGNVAFQKGTDYSTTGITNNVNFGTGVLFRLTGASAQTITGIAGGADGRIMTLVNAAAQAATLKNNDTVDSTAANVIITGTGSDLTIAAGASVNLVYDSTASVWRVVGTISGATSGGSYVTLQGTTPGTADIGNFNINGTGIAATLQGSTTILSPALDTITAGTLSIGTSTATAVSIGKTGATTTVNGALTVTQAATFSSSVTVAANQSVTLTGGTTATRPASPTEGMIYYDTTTKQLLTYANGKWQGDSTQAVVVAASDSTQADKDAADYVADGNTATANDGDQVQINAALTAAAGRKVVLLAGTYTLDASISIPNNTTLTGVGMNTLITIPNALNAYFSAIVNTDQTTGTNVTLQDLRLDGNNANQSGSVGMVGVAFTNMGGGSGATARAGSNIKNIESNNWYKSGGSNCQTGYGICLRNSSNNTLTGNNTQGNTGSGIYLISSPYNTLSNNIAQGNGIGIGLINAASNTLTGNVAQGNTSDGFRLTTSNNNAVTGNMAQGNGNFGVNITGSSNTISGNKLDDNGGSTANNGIILSSADSNTITGNNITDTSATSTNYAINISDSTSDTNYLADNTLGGGSINDVGTGTIYGNQQDGSGNLINKSQGGGFTIGAGTASASFSLQGGLISTTLPAPAAPTLTISGTTGLRTYGYKITALDGTGETLASTETTTTSGYSTLSSTNKVNIAWAPVGGAVQYKVYRTTTNGTPATTGLIATVAGNVTTVSDTGLAASGSLPVANTTGNVTIAGSIQGNSLTTINSATIGTTLQVNGATTLSGGLTVTGNVAFQKGTDYSTTGATNDVNFGNGALIRLTGASVQTITGIAGGIDGRLLTIVNAAAQAATLSNNSTSSLAANRIVTGTGADLSVAAGASVNLVYDATSSVWRVVGTISGATSGGSYVSLQGTTPGTADTGNFNITGTGIAATLQGSTTILSPALDTISAGTLSVGTSTATAVSIGKAGATTTVNGALTVAQTATFSGNITASGSFDQSASTGTFKTGTGAVSLNGDTAVASGKTLTVNGSGFNASGNLGIGTTSPGANLDVQSTATSGNAVNITANSLTSGTALTVGQNETISTSTSTTSSLINTSRAIAANVAPVSVAVDAYSQATAAGSGSSSLSWSHTTGSYSNRYLLVSISAYSSQPSAVTYNGTSLTYIGSITTVGGNHPIWLYGMVAPQVGTFSLNVTGANIYTAFATTFYNVDQTTPVGAPSGSVSTNTSPVSQTLSTSVGQLVVDVIDSNQSDSTPGSGQTNMQYYSGNGYARSTYKAASTGSTTISETLSSPNGANYIAIAIHYAGAGGVTISGNLANLSSNCTITAGTCSDISNILNLNQQYSGATGAVASIQNAGTGDMIDLLNGSGTLVAKFDASGNLQVPTVNAISGYKFNGTAGATTTCSAGQFLQNQVVQGGITTGGTCAAAGGGVATIGALDGGTYSANGASISGTTLYLQAATGTHVGLVTTGTQTFAGSKTFLTDSFGIQETTNSQYVMLTTGDNVDFRISNATTNGKFRVFDNNAAVYALTVDAATSTITLGENTVVAASQSLTLTGGTTATRPAAPTEGMLYYDTTTKQLLTYANGKWQADRAVATKIIAPSNASQAEKDSADVVLTGTADQTAINTALTAAAGGKVYILDGTVNVSGAISVPNNTTLSGAGAGTIITLPNAQNGSYNIVTNTTTTGGTGVTIENLTIDGNKANQTSGTMYGIYLNGMGTNTTQGATVKNVSIKNVYGGDGVVLNNAYNNVVSGSTFIGTGGSGVNIGPLTTSNSNTVSGNVFSSNSYGISIYGTGNTIIGNNIHNNSEGILFLGTYNSTISGNIISNNSSQGIDGYSGGGTGNTISANTIANNGMQGIYHNDSDDTVTGNTISSNGSEGIVILGSRNTISGNRLFDNGGGTDNDAIKVTNSGASNSITGNTITDGTHTSTNYAINIVSGSSTYVSDNTLGGGSINDAGTGTIYGGQLNSSNAYAIQAAGGINLNSATTVNNTLTVAPLTDTRVMGSELMSSSKTFSAAAGWTSISGTGQSATATHNGTISDTTPLAISTALSLTAGQDYKLIFTVSGQTTGYFKVYVGGTAIDSSLYGFNQTETISFNAPAAGNLTFVPYNATFDGTISGVSIKQYVGPLAAALTVNNASGNPAFELRVNNDSSNMFLGVNAGQNITSGGTNTALGSYSLQNTTTGSNNTATGFDTLASNTTGSDNTAIGSWSMSSNTTGYQNTAIGSNTLYYNTTGYGNTALGGYAISSNTTGYGNTALGSYALYSNTTGYQNAVLGDHALYYNTTGYQNTALGGYALSANTTGAQNTALGGYALQSNTTGNDNIAIGYLSQMNASSGSSNISVGDNTLANISNETGNTAIGQSALNSTSGSYNSALGYRAGWQDSNGWSTTTSSALQNATAIGAYAQVQTSNSIVLGSVDLLTKVGIGITAPTNMFSVSPLDYQTGTATRTNGSATLVGTGTTWSSTMVGDRIVFADGTTNTVAGFTDATHITMNITYTGTTDSSPIRYRFHRPGLQVSGGGDVYVQNTSTTAFQIQDSSSVALFIADTTNKRLYVGPTAGSTTGTLLVLGNKTTSGDPTGVNGAMYYNSNTNRFRCYENGAWQNCLSRNDYTPAFIGYNADPSPAVNLGAANRLQMVAVTVPVPVTMTGIRLSIGTASGNISVALYDNSGTRLATSGSVASPAAGVSTVNFTASATINPGIYYLAVSADNTTVTFSRFGVLGVAGMGYFDSAFPAPASLTLPGSVASNAARAVSLVGIVSGGVTQ